MQVFTYLSRFFFLGWETHIVVDGCYGHNIQYHEKRLREGLIKWYVFYNQNLKPNETQILQKKKSTGKKIGVPCPPPTQISWMISYVKFLLRHNLYILHAHLFHLKPSTYFTVWFSKKKKKKKKKTLFHPFFLIGSLPS